MTATGLGLAGTDAANYTVNSMATTIADIARLAIVGTVMAGNKVYDGTTAATITTRTLTGVLTGDIVNYVGGTAVFSDPNAGPGKTVAATGLGLAGTDAANYSVNSTAAAIADIARRALTVAANPGQTKVYGDVDPALTYTVTSGSLVAGDAFAGMQSRDGGENVGGYAINRNTLTAGPNYDLTYVSSLFSITPATLTYLAKPVTLQRGAALPEFTGSVEGFKRDDTLALATTGTLAFATTVVNSSQLGMFPIDGSGLTANLGNYVFVQDPANATALAVQPRNVTELAEFDGAIATALQTDGACTRAHGGNRAADGDDIARCHMRTRASQHESAATFSGRASQQRVVTPIADTAFSREGAGIRLPTGTTGE